ncbi:MAG: ATP-binding cassette domain-containing protein [Chitinophagaceae bacterium]
MRLHINNLLPVYFDESRKESTGIWGRNLSFTEDEWIKIVAPSGSGKTSLIHFLYGMRQDYTGTISYDNADLRIFSKEDLARIRKDHISIVFQDMKLFANLTVLENLEIKRQLNPFHPAEKIEEMCSLLGIGDKLKSKCSSCSYGEQQRVSIIRALLQPFDILLLDEPFSHLDQVNMEKALSLISTEAKKRKACTVYTDLERNKFFPYTRLLHL